MRLKDIFWPWGRINDDYQYILRLNDLLHLQGDNNMAVRANNEHLKRKEMEFLLMQQEVISSNLRSECLRLHEELEARMDALEIVYGTAWDAMPISWKVIPVDEVSHV